LPQPERLSLWRELYTAQTLIAAMLLEALNCVCLEEQLRRLPEVCADSKRKRLPQISFFFFF
jgi:hypothetical protein